MTIGLAVLIAAAAYHRPAARGEVCPDVDRFGSRMMLAALVPLGLGVSGEIAV